MDTGTPKIIAKKGGGIGWLIFNQPEKHNAMSFAMWQAIPKVMADFEADPAVRVIVFTGAGERAFVSGADISEFEEKRDRLETVKIYDQASEAANKAMIGATKPTIAMIRGYCIGGGLAIALTTDIRIAAEGSTFAVPAAKLGLGYGYAGIRRLADVVGPSFAKEIFYTARQFSTEEAKTMGLVNRVLPVGELHAYVEKYCSIIAGNAPMTIKAAKMAINAAVTDEGVRDSAGVKAAVEACFASEDYKEGRRAFMEKRKPQFKGK